MKTQHALRKEKGMIVKWDFQWSCPDLLFPVKCNQYGDTVSREFMVYEITKAEKKRKKKQNKTKQNKQQWNRASEPNARNCMYVSKVSVFVITRSRWEGVCSFYRLIYF